MAGPGDAKSKRKNRSSAASTPPGNTGSSRATRGRSKPSHGGEVSKPSVGPAARELPGLHVVATPIGNARDITLRALDVLGRADVIACEDTRVTAKLLAIHGISRPLAPYHEHNAEKARPGLIRRLKKGETVALVSDAGTPLVSDPGFKLVRACLDAEIPVIPLPGASSVLAALVVSGLPTDRFFFAGFLPPKSSARRRALGEIAEIPGSLVFMESAKRLAASLADMADVLGDREAVIAREMTKMFEEVRRGTLAGLASHYGSEPPPKGEVSIVVAPFSRPPIDDAELDRRLIEAMKNATLRDAAGDVSAVTGIPKRRVYARALEIKQGTG
ncbi:MAG: 16S rRNA (cytidine(1402)-2'-O)-methyltransferase [Proteobacteria bacterium]|nr:16S rRNA (cytidine(1402)-2'-O)-methyltransferase [Pseudomonadota bacterium]